MDTLIPTGSPAPDFALPALDGTLHRLSDLRSRVVILNFWSAECPWAERTDEEILTYLEDWGETVVLWPVASNANEPPALLAQEAARRGLPLVLHDAQQTVAGLYGAQTTPHVFVIDEQGILSYQGAVNNVSFRQRTPTGYYLRQAVDAVLAGRSPDPAQTPPYGCTIVRYA